MNTFVDCPYCGSEFVIDEAIASSNLRCPDCLQWVNNYIQDSPKTYVAAYASGYDNYYYENADYEAGYDY